MGGGEPRFGQLGDIPSYVMVKCGTWGEDACQLHRFFGWNKVKVGRKVPFYVSADDCYVDETCIKGSVNVIGAKEHPEWMCDNGSMKWDLKIDKKVAFTDITCEKKDMLFVNYEAPNCKKLHNRLWNGGNGKGSVKLYIKRGGGIYPCGRYDSGKCRLRIRRI